MDNKQIHIIGGGTLNYVGSHLAITAPAYGTTAKHLDILCRTQLYKMDTVLHLTKMAGGAKLETNRDIETLVEELIKSDQTKIIFMTAAIADFGPTTLALTIGEYHKYGTRQSSKAPFDLRLYPQPKIIHSIRKTRKDIFLVAFKQTCGLPENEQYIAGLHLCKEASANLVLANDVKTRLNMVITPEEAKYHVTTDRTEALWGLVEMTKLRSHLTFTRSTVKNGDPIPWDSDLVPPTLRTVINYCISRGAYKPFRGSTAGHFAVKLDDTTFLTSIRKTDFNNLSNVGLVKVVTDGPDSVMAYGAKPSVGGQSQRIVFHNHIDYDLIIHFHCPIKPDSQVPVASQREFECGSHQCGENTSNHLKRFGNLSAVYLDQHGPNIVFHRSIDPQEVIGFIEANFDLEEKTGGFVSVKKILDTPSTLESAQAIL